MLYGEIPMARDAADTATIIPRRNKRPKGALLDPMTGNVAFAANITRWRRNNGRGQRATVYKRILLMQRLFKQRWVAYSLSVTE